MTDKLLSEKFNIKENGTICGEREYLHVNSDDIHEIIKTLNRMPEFNYDVLTSITAADLYDLKSEKGDFELIYSLYASSLNKILLIKTTVERNNPSIQSICDIFPSANYDEREIFDLFGIKFNGHHHLKRILMTNDWLGYPLRKDYVMQDERLSWNKR